MNVMSNNLMRISFCALLLFSQELFSQTYLFAVEQLHLAQYIKVEKEAGSLSVKNSTQYFNTSGFNLGQPSKYIRTNIPFYPKPVVEYFFSLPDSMVREIHLELDSMNFISKFPANYVEKNKRLNEFNKRYDEILKELISAFGNPIQSKNLEKRKQLLGDKILWDRSDEWSMDSIRVSIHLAFSDNSTNEGIYRIRVKIIYLKLGSKIEKSLNGK